MPPTKIPQVVHYLRKLNESRDFPIVNDDGFIIQMVNKRGAQARAGAKILQGDSLNAFLKAKFPHLPLHYASSPCLRALEHQSKSGGQWTQATINEAALEFLVPAQTRFLVIFPEAFDRVELFKDKTFRAKDKKTGKETGGVMSRCPHCQDNQHVRFSKWLFCAKQERPRRSAHCDGATTFFAGGQYECSNPECAGSRPPNERNKDGSEWTELVEKTRAHTFQPWTKECFRLYPDVIRKKYSGYVYGLGEDEEPQYLPSPELAHRLLDTDTNFSALEKELKNHFGIITQKAVQDYQLFVTEHGTPKTRSSQIPDFFRQAAAATAKPTTMFKWPEFDRKAFEEDFAPPGYGAIRTMFFIVFRSIRPHLRRDLLSRVPGRILRWDGTYDLAKKLMADGLSELSAAVLLLVCGEYGHIVFFAFADAESETNWKLINLLLKERCERVGMQHVQKVIAAYTDTCCCNLKNPSKHWFAIIWPNATRAPLKDPLHGMMQVTRTVDKDSEIHQPFCSELSGCLIENDFNSYRDITREYMTEYRDATVVQARKFVASMPTWRSRVYKQSVKRSDSISRINTLYIKTDEANSKLIADGEPPFFTNKSRHKRGTKAEFDNLKEHVQKGCYEDPLPCREMSYPLHDCSSDDEDDSGSGKTKRKGKRPPKLGSRRGTSGLESSNKTTNKSAADQTRLGMELGDARTELRVHQHNNRKDIILRGVAAADPSVIPVSKSIFWWVDEENDQHAINLSNLESGAAARRLSRLPQKDFIEEPTGSEFLRYKEGINVEGVLFFAGVSETVTASVARAARETSHPSYLHAAAAVATLAEAAPLTVATMPAPAPPDAGATAVAASAAGAGASAGAATTAATNAPTTATTGTGTTGTTTTTATVAAGPASSQYYHSSGATVWGRKEQGHRGRPLTQHTVTLPLDPMQQAVAATILGQLTVTAPQSQQQTVNQLATNLQQHWNTTHSMALLANMPSVQGGMLTQPCAQQIVTQATTAAVTQAFGFLPRGGMMLPFHAPIQPRQGAVAPTVMTAAPVLKELNALTEAEVQALTAKEALDYCRKFNISRPASKADRIQAVLSYMRNPGQHQQEQRGKKRTVEP
jgi:hypothetical protein